MPTPTPYRPPPNIPGGGGSSDGGVIETILKIGLVGVFAVIVGAVLALVGSTLVHQFRRGKQLGSGPEGVVLVVLWLGGAGVAFWWMYTH